jgi:hypothetical protein
MRATIILVLYVASVGTVFAVAPNISDMPDSILAPSKERKVEKDGTILKNIKIKDVKTWPDKPESLATYNVRDVFHDPTQALAEARENNEVQAQVSPVQIEQRRIEQEKVQMDQREKTAVTTQSDAWNSLLQMAHVSSVMKTQGDGIVLFTIDGTGESYRMRVGESLRLTFDHGQSGSTGANSRSALLRQNGSYGAGQQGMSLSTITIKLLKITSKDLYFRIEEINGNSFFNDEQPIWAYEYSPGSL